MEYNAATKPTKATTTISRRKLGKKKRRVKKPQNAFPTMPLNDNQDIDTSMFPKYLIPTTTNTRQLKGGWIDPLTLPINKQGFRCCRWCGESIHPPRRTFCSDACVHELRLRTQPGYVRQCCYDRDKGICHLCKVDTKVIAKMARKLDGKARVDYLEKHSIRGTRKIHARKHGGGLWDADHTVAVVNGGGLCGLENIRTLCIACHKGVTKVMLQTKASINVAQNVDSNMDQNVAQNVESNMEQNVAQNIESNMTPTQ